MLNPHALVALELHSGVLASVFCFCFATAGKIILRMDKTFDPVEGRCSKLLSGGLWHPPLTHRQASTSSNS